MSLIPVVDVFAGPGGLGEGFSAFCEKRGRPFHIVCSVEKEGSAHATLTLRAFYRLCQWELGYVPSEYYQYVRGEISREALFNSYPEFAQNARVETLWGPRALGQDNEAIDRQIELQLGKFDGPCVLIGGPPCQAYSLVGRSRNKGVAGYRIEDDPRSRLYREYLRLVDRFSPEVFIMENVKGMLSARVDGQEAIYRILEDLADPHRALEKAGKGPCYRILSLSVAKLDVFSSCFSPKDFVIRSEEYGIPQARHRVILLGIRDDVPIDGKKLTLERIEIEKSPDLKSVIADLPRLRSGLSKEPDTYERWREALECVSRQMAQNGEEPALDRAVMRQLRTAPATWRQPHSDRGGRFVPVRATWNPEKHMPTSLAAWLVDKQLGGVLNHETRGHIRQDLARYLFCIANARSSHWTRFKSPKLQNFPNSLMPDHADKNMVKFTDRFRVQNPHAAATTVTSHISKDGHYYIHPDISQVRSFTVREAARVQTFPDNYFFEGNRTQQYIQVGNAVPPLLANQIAAIVHGLLA